MSGPPGGGRLARVGRAATRLAAAGLLALIALGWLGQAVRDRSAAWALPMYLPLPLLGGAAVGLDLLRRGRGFPPARLRFALAAVGLATAAGSARMLVGGGSGGGRDDPPGATRPAAVLHWNVIWGGGRRRNPARWASIRRTIAAQKADVIVLSEAPPDDRLDEVVADLGPTGGRVQVENDPGATYWYKLAVCSARPVRLLGRPPVRNGAAMAVAVDLGGATGPLRLLVVDGRSSPLLARTPFLEDVAGLCRAAEAAGEPFDLVAGDFNSLARSIGFDALEGAGYALAARSSGSWRGTFPSFAPVYDIDHIWAHRARWPGPADRLFTDLASDHRGQVAYLRPPGP